MAVHNEIGFDLADISGGLKYNAIPRNAECLIAIDKKDEAALKDIIKKYSDIFADEYRVNDPDIALSCEAAEAADTILDEESKMRVFRLYELLGNRYSKMGSGLSSVR